MREPDSQFDGPVAVRATILLGEVDEQQEDPFPRRPEEQSAEPPLDPLPPPADELPDLQRQLAMPAHRRFEDAAGKNFRALADETGHRAGHFIDDAGNTFRGFSDASGKQVDRIMDEAGNALDAASGWAASTWNSLADAASSLTSSVTGGSSSLRNAASESLGGIQDQSARLNDMLQTAFRDRPLVGGALAFAFGAAIGAALPRTEQEDALMGEAASDVRKTVKAEADKVVDRGSEIASKVTETAASVASDMRDVAKDRIGEEFGRFTGSQQQDRNTSRPH